MTAAGSQSIPRPPMRLRTPTAPRRGRARRRLTWARVLHPLHPMFRPPSRQERRPGRAASRATFRSRPARHGRRSAGACRSLTAPPTTRVSRGKAPSHARSPMRWRLRSTALPAARGERVLPARPSPVWGEKETTWCSPSRRFAREHRSCAARWCPIRLRVRSSSCVDEGALPMVALPPRPDPVGSRSSERAVLERAATGGA
jgi:hypothetical protein